MQQIFIGYKAAKALLPLKGIQAAFFRRDAKETSEGDKTSTGTIPYSPDFIGFIPSGVVSPSPPANFR
jgi:hypothetical protein